LGELCVSNFLVNLTVWPINCTLEAKSVQVFVNGLTVLGCLFTNR
jgi:hypothetical protein